MTDETDRPSISIVKSEDYTETYRFDMSETAAKAQIEVAKAKYAAPARAFAFGLVGYVLAVVIGIVIVASINMEWQAKVAAFAALGGATWVFKKPLEHLIKSSFR
ncbi:MAG TPA: hypothetical protein VHO25_02390 [Polyangiaceae bacterium]|nr:hypothetical protein [Polyangiaceae bacterium]